MAGIQIDRLHTFLDDPRAEGSWLLHWGLADPERGHANLVQMATAGVTLDLLADICEQLGEHLPTCSDPDMALNNLSRFIASSRSPLSLASLFERDREALPILVQIFSTSQHLSDLLVSDNEAYDLLRITEGTPVHRDTLVQELSTEATALPDERSVLIALRRLKRRETLRICYGDIVRRQRLETVTAQISYLADAIIEAAVRSARRRLVEKRGEPRRPDGQPARFVVLGMGKLGGTELNYSSDIDLIFLYDEDGQTDGPRQLTNLEFFDRLARDVVRLLSEVNDYGAAYRVDLRLRPEGTTGPMVTSLEQSLHYYDVLGRTWERQAYIKARPVAGDLELGIEFLRRMEPWIYRRYLGLADIAGIKALKRRIEQRTQREGADSLNVKTGHGGIRDIEFVIQFLQLLNGADLPELRTGNTLTAIAQLESCGCLTHQERTLLESNYAFLRRIEHLLQIMFDLQTHTLPSQPDEVRKLAIRMGYRDQETPGAREAFASDYQSKTAINRRILDHLLHDAFGDDAQTEPEVDLVLDPDPPPERISEVLSRYGFRDVKEAYKNLMALSTEGIRFLSTRRCRHFLASIAPRLLRAIAGTPDPDQTLVNLEKVSDSLGGKGVLWELFNFNPPTLRLYVDICASSPFLSGMLTGNPGMIDELMDSLVLNKLPKLDTLRQVLEELCRAAEDIDPILHSFKTTQQLQVGVRDILGKEDIQATTQALSDIAQVCLEQITDVEFDKLAAKYGQPTLAEGPREGQPADLVIVAMGKFGGRELNYHSDLDIIFLYESDGQTVHTRRSRTLQTTSNQHFFSELGSRIIKFSSRLGPSGRLYDVDPRLRPTGRSGALATSLDEFTRYYAEGLGQIWERQALCKARVVYGSPEAAGPISDAIARAAFDHPWHPEGAQQIWDMRLRLEYSSSASNLKRGPGGIVDIEFLVQVLQLKHGRDDSTIRVPRTLCALEKLQAAGYLDRESGEFLARSYRFLRQIEARLRLMSTAARDDLPDSPTELDKLGRMLGFPDGKSLMAECLQYTQRNRECFERVCAER